MSAASTRELAKTLRYSRIVRTADGGSRFIDAELDLADRNLAAGVPAMAVAGLSSAATVTYLRSSQFDSDPHPAPAEQWVVMVRGVIEVTTSDGRRRRFGPGDLVHVEDTDGHGHVTVGVGDAPFEALFVPTTNSSVTTDH
ncbi:cupin domain-containing protein [Nocardia sp. CA-107356]|uniref:cupin domain-containing protein n=1 Tax=Nocardia sp. CA-107356 TaxID=3239972 RepID=UPI003D9041C1